MTLAYLKTLETVYSGAVFQYVAMRKARIVPLQWDNFGAEDGGIGVKKALDAILDHRLFEVAGNVENVIEMNRKDRAKLFRELIEKRRVVV